MMSYDESLVNVSPDPNVKTKQKKLSTLSGREMGLVCYCSSMVLCKRCNPQINAMVMQSFDSPGS